MVNIYHLGDMTAFTTTRRCDLGYEGEVRIVFGPRPLRVVHVCLPIRDSAPEAELDAQRDAKMLIRMWADQVPLQ